MADDDRFAFTLAGFGTVLAHEAEELFYETVGKLPSADGTPIEKLMGLALAFAFHSIEWFGAEGWGEPRIIWPHCFPNADVALETVPTRDGASLWFQAPVGKYTADFLLTIAQENGGYATSAIECDGHDFHNVTKTQASHDRARDREFQQRGLLILRYTGSDIWRSPLKCAVDAITITKDRSRQSTAKRWAK